MSDQIVVGFGWKAALDKEVVRMQMMRLRDGERPMVRELRAFVVSVTDKNEQEFMCRFRQFAAIDDLDNPVAFFPRSWADWKRLGIVCLRQLLLLPLRLLGFHSPLKTCQPARDLNFLTTMDHRLVDEIRINNEVAAFISLGRRRNDFDDKGREMR